jgi:hypothetical protein
VTPSSGGGPRKLRSDRGRRRVDGNDDERSPTLRDLPGVGAAIERRLHDAGLTSVADLANANETELVERIGDVRGVTAGKIHEWIAAARDITSAAAVTEADQGPVDRMRETRQGQMSELPERQESFVLTLSVDELGNVERSTIRHTRTGLEGTRHGWSSEHLATFIASHARLAIGDIAAAKTTPTGSRLVGLRPVGEPVRLNLDAGHLIGGRRRSARVTVEPPEIPWDVAQYDYDLVVTARQLGLRRWRPLGRVRGRATTGEELAVELAAADLPAAVHRITLTGQVRAVVPNDRSSNDTPVEASETTA